MAESEIMEAKKQIAVLKEIVRVGTVSSVDAEQRTAKVIIYDKIKEFVSGPLKVLQNQPLITVEKWVDGTKWEYDAKYASVDRSLGLGESYTKAAPDVIKKSNTPVKSGSTNRQSRFTRGFPISGSLLYASIYRTGMETVLYWEGFRRCRLSEHGAILHSAFRGDR